MDFKWLITLAITVGGWCVSIGMYIAKIKQHDNELKEIKNHQQTTDQLLINISNQLADLNSKVGLLIQGKINTGKEK